MPSGIILSSGSQGATQEAIEKVLEANGYETEKPEVTEPELVEPKRDDFESDEAFEQAQEEFEAKQEEAERAAEEKEEQERQKKEAAESGRKPTRRQRAIDKATKDLQAQLRQANERLAALEGKGGAAKSEPAVVKVPEAPKREAFKTDAEYDEAMFDYRYKLRRAKEEAESAENAQKAQLETNWKNYQDQVAEFKEEHDDWDEVVNQKIPLHESVYLAVIEQANGAQVTYYLGKHPDYARKLAEMSPLSAVMEVGRLAERLKTGAPRPGEAGSGAKTKPKPKLPEPVTPVSTSATSSTLSSREAAQKRDFRAFKAAQRRGV